MRRSENGWFWVTFVIVCLSYLNPINSATVKATPFVLLSLFCMTQRGYMNHYRSKAVVYMIVGAVLTLMFHDILETKDFIMVMACLSSLSFLSEKFEFQPKHMYWAFCCAMLATSVFNMATGQPVTWIPRDGIINIFGVGTKHGTAVAGTLLLLPTACYMYEKYRGVQTRYSWRKLILMFLFSFYLIVFSSSRSVTLAALAFIGYLFVNRNHFSKSWSIAIFIFCNASVFFMEYLSNYVSIINEYPILADFVHTDNFNNSYGVTSGRSWLWGVHMNGFINSPFLMGGGRAVTDFGVNDWLPWLGEEAHAGSESTYTGYIACWGLLGIGIVLMQIGMFLHAVNKKSIMASAVMFCMIYNTTMGQAFVLPYGYADILCFLLYYACLQRSERYPQLR